MRRFLTTIDRWGPALVSVVALFVVCGIAWTYTERIARLEGMVTSQQNQLNACLQSSLAHQTELSGLNKWIVAVYAKLDASGWDIPPLPNTKGQGHVTKEDPVQPPGRKDGGKR